MTDRIGPMTLDSTEVVSAVIGDKALLASAADGTSIEVNSVTGKLGVPSSGSSLSNGVQRVGMSKFAGARLVGNLTASDAAAGVVSVQNTYGTDLIVERLFLDVTTATSGACTLDAGVAATAILASDLMSGANPSTVILLDNHTSPALSSVKWPSTEFLTVSMASGATAGLVGTYQIIFSDMN